MWNILTTLYKLFSEIYKNSGILCVQAVSYKIYKQLFIDISKVQYKMQNSIVQFV